MDVLNIQLITPQIMADRTSLKMTKIYDLIRRKKIRSFKVEGQVLLDLNSVNQYLDRQAEKSDLFSSAAA
jgi:excisionase family DNA binding protein